VLIGAKIPEERFAGAINTLTCEAMMGDGKALQMGTSHELGQNFSRAFDIGYQDANGAQQLCWTTSWGVSTRMMGGLIMAHGDDSGLRVPPRLAAVQAVVLVVKDDDEGTVTEAARQLHRSLVDQGVRARLDDHVATAFGRRATDWELKGVPLRIEVGPRDLAEGRAVVSRRDTGEKVPMDLGAIPSAAVDLLGAIQTALHDGALADRQRRTVDCATVEETAAAAVEGFARVPWSVLDADALERLGRDALTVRCVQTPEGDLPDGLDDPDNIAIVARAY
jgi:prolyl-tRNA synthetase